jgi:flavin reductase (DIM6/NTAB) family NADH-FMN oxidoreductase RutF/DNA-binding GntR family transcriptional regulator
VPPPVAEPQPFDPIQFRHVVGHLASGVTIVTTGNGVDRSGMTASSVTSLSSDPPMMLACLNNAAPTAAAVGRARRYVVNILGEGAGELAYRFATPSHDKFAGVDVETGVSGAPLIADALAHIECEVVEEVVGGTHTIFLGRVLAAHARSGPPLTYFRGGFGRFEFAQDDEVYRRARQLILDRAFAAGDVLEVESLASALDVDLSACLYALTRLAGDRLVRRDPDRGYVVTPFDVRTSEVTFDARLAIELGVVEQILETTSDQDLVRLRERFEEMAALLVGDRFVDFDAYLDANYRFHEYLVSLARNPALSATFGSLSIKQVMTRSFGSTPVTSQQFIAAQRDITEAIERRDPRQARTALRRYADLAKARAREILAENGGQL